MFIESQVGTVLQWSEAAVIFHNLCSLMSWLGLMDSGELEWTHTKGSEGGIIRIWQQLWGGVWREGLICWQPQNDKCLQRDREVRQREWDLSPLTDLRHCGDTEVEQPEPAGPGVWRPVQAWSTYQGLLPLSCSWVGEVFSRRPSGTCRAEWRTRVSMPMAPQTNLCLTLLTNAFGISEHQFKFTAELKGFQFHHHYHDYLGMWQPSV